MWKLPRGGDTPEASRSARQTEGTMLCDFWEQKEKEKRKPALELTLILHVFFWGGCGLGNGEPIANLDKIILHQVVRKMLQKSSKPRKSI